MSLINKPNYLIKQLVKNTSRSFTSKHVFILGCACLINIQANALEQLDDETLANTTGEGLAFFAKKFSLSMEDTDYIRITSTGGDAVSTGKKAEIYAYGLKLGGSGSTGRAVTKTNLGTVDNPAILKVYKTDAVPNFDPAQNGGEEEIDVMEVRLSTRDGTGSDETLKFSTWLDLIGRDSENFQAANNAGDRTRIAVIGDKFSLNGSKFQLWQSLDHPTNIDYTNRFALSGLLRINTAETGSLRLTADTRTNPDAIAKQTNPSLSQFGAAVVTKAPKFGADEAINNKEGLYWKNFDLNMPLGALGYQPVMIGSGGANGRELVLEVARIPNNPKAYNAAYINYEKYDNPADPDYTKERKKMCTASSCDDTATHANLSFQLSTRLANGDYTNLTDKYYGVGLGKRVSTTGQAGTAGINVDSNGVVSMDALQTLGTSVETQGGTYNKFEGMFVQHLKITTNAFGQ